MALQHCYLCQGGEDHWLVGWTPSYTTETRLGWVSMNLGRRTWLWGRGQIQELFICYCLVWVRHENVRNTKGFELKLVVVFQYATRGQDVSLV